ncbi:MAG: hypothetical protein ACLQAH_04595 [Limisphaerales bacterium]
MKKQILKLSAMFLIPAVFLAFTSCSSTPQSQTASDLAMRGGVVVDVVTATATVQSVNAGDRTVVLQRQDGSLMTYECGPEVLNFDQIKVGDQVTGQVADAVALVLVKGGVPPSAGTASVIVRAPLGAKPGGKMVHTVGFTAKVTSVDVLNREVTLQTVDGKTQTVKVGPDINLSNVKSGDDVGVQLTRAIMIAVTSPAKTTP